VNASLFEQLTPLLATYLIHSTCLIGAVALLVRLRPPHSAQMRQTAWKLAMLLGLVTAPLQAELAIVPFGGQVALPVSVGERVAANTSSVQLPRPPAGNDGLDRLVQEEISGLEGPSHDQLDGLRRPSHNDSVGTLSHGEVGLGRTHNDQQDGLGRPSHGPDKQTSTGPTSGLQRAEARGPNPWHTAIGVAWLAGVSFCGLRVAMGWLRLGGPRGLVELRRGPERRTLDELCRQAGVKRRVRLYRADDGATPIAWGLVLWHIALPSALANRLNHRELRALLAHELGHLARGDTRWLWLASVIGSLGFVQPLNKLAQRKICREAELLSDRWAVARTGDRLALASSLTAVAELLLGPTVSLAAGAATSRSALRERLEVLLDERPLGPANVSAGSRSLAAILGTLLAAGVVLLLPAVKLPIAAAVTASNTSSTAPSDDLGEAVDGVWHEFELLDLELARLEPALAAAQHADASDAAERIRRQSKALLDRREQLRGMLQAGTITRGQYSGGGGQKSDD
jgi:beta-lactamase regulating signal transducer with metallopeptidase domain